MNAGAKVLTIRPGTPFLDALAAGILHEAGDDPLALADMTILLPTRRACRAIREAFLRAGDGKPLLLPALRPIGDVDEEELLLGEAPEAGFHDDIDLPPTIPGLRRQLLLSRLICGWRGADGAEAIPVDRAARLATELAQLLDEVQTERLSFDRLADLVPQDYALHWQKTIAFLEILTRHWPALLAEEGALDPAERRNRLLAAKTAAWRAAPPAGPVIAAGTTGSVPATGDLLATVAALPQGRVVLPGLDRDLDAASWEAVKREPTHPQHGMARLLDRLGIAPAEVPDWSAPGFDGRGASHPARAVLLSEAMRPARTTDRWRALKAISPAALRGVERVDCPGEAEEAGVIALAMRQTLEEEGRTAALVTPDRRLARRVAAELRRWGIEVDDSAGRSLADTPPGSFLRLTAAMAASELAPVAFLAALKHPLAAGGIGPGAFRRRVRLLERLVLRGARPGPGFAGLRAALDAGAGEPDAVREIATFLDDLESRIGAFAELLAGGDNSFEAFLTAHVAAAEALAETDDESGAARLWAGDAGEALAAFVAEAGLAGAVLPPLAGSSYPALLDALLAGRVVRPQYGRHPRLHIWGLLEARLQHADLLILGGLNEGTWPREARPDPWLSRPMRERFGLPLPERRIGLSAHDFAQAFCASRVMLTRAGKVDGAPTVPSRFLARLETVLRGAGAAEEFGIATQWLAWQRALGRPREFEQIAAPAPRPPVSSRPRRLSVTQIETWMRDPYAIYARHILGLRPLDPLEADPGAADRGSFIHAALDRFLRDHPGDLPPDAVERLLELGRTAFAPALVRPAVRAFWWPRFERIARWFVEAERARRATISGTATETRGQLTVDGPAGAFTLTAMADRIDRLQEGGYAIIDYKTGGAPSEKVVALGYAPQLPLEAAIAAAGGFEGLAAAPVQGLEYWRLSGGDPAGEAKPLGGDPMTLAEEALAGLERLVAAFDDPNTAYRASPNPAQALRFNDYAHLARTAEWSAGGETDT